MLAAESLRKIYTAGGRSVEAVAGVSLQVAAGEFVAVCGRSGSGKSTLLGMLGGICRPSDGRVVIDGEDVWSFAPEALADLRARRVGFVFQFPSLLPTLRAVDNVALPSLLGAGELDAAYARAEELLAYVGLADRLDASPGELSGGEQRRVALARALINRPPLILADEPTSDLDEETEAEIFDLLLGLRQASRSTLVLVSHRLELARRADRVVHLRDGRLVETEEPAPSPVRPRSPARALVGPRRPADETARPAPLGVSLARFARRFAGWAVAVVAGILVLNFVVASLQQRALARAHAAGRELERTALQQLRADVESVAYGPDGTYRLTLYLQNLEPARDLFVLAPSVRVFVQGERGWEEVPSWSIDDQGGRVVRVAGRQRVAFAFRPEVKKFEEIIAGYYHVRISNAMLVSPRRDPRSAVFDRTDAYYVYLKPHGADDAAILRRNRWSAGVAPVWIPMPPH